MIDEAYLSRGVYLLIHAVSNLLLLGIAVGFLLSAIWSLKYILLTKTPYLKQIKLQHVLALSLVSLSYLIVAILNFTEYQIHYSIFAGVVLRPILCYMGFMEAAISRDRYIRAKIEKEKINEIVRKYGEKG